MAAPVAHCRSFLNGILTYSKQKSHSFRTFFHNSHSKIHTRRLFLCNIFVFHAQNILLTTDFAWKNIFFDIFLTLNAGCAAPACRPFPVPLAFLLSFARREKTVDGKALFCYTVKAINMEMYRSGRNENDSKSKWMLRQISPFQTRKRQNLMF